MKTRKYLVASCLVAALAVASVACSATSPSAAPTAAPKAAATSTAPEPTKAGQADKQAAPASNAVAKPAGWPTRPINLIVPYDAGGGSDIGFRLLAPLMEPQLGTSIQIINKPGAGSQTGLTEMATAKPDGYTIANTSIPATITIALDEERKAAFKADDFEHIGLHVYDVGLIAVRSDSKYKTLKEFVDDAKANPGKVTAGTTGILGDDHLAILQLQKLTGAKFGIVHFTGGAPQITAMLGGHIDSCFDNVGDFAKTYNSGQFRILAVMDKERSRFLKDVPTAEEQGFKLYSASARSLSAPKGTPKEIVSFMSKAMEQAMKDPEHIRKMEEQGLGLKYMNPEEYNKYWTDSIEQIKPLMPLAREK